MQENPTFRGGRNIALYVPANQFEATISAYRQLGIPVAEESSFAAALEFGPIRLHVVKSEEATRAEVRLEFITSDIEAAKTFLENTQFEVYPEPLPEPFAGFWTVSPASLIHLVTDAE